MNGFSDKQHSQYLESSDFVCCWYQLRIGTGVVSQAEKIIPGYVDSYVLHITFANP